MRLPHKGLQTTEKPELGVSLVTITGVRNSSTTITRRYLISTGSSIDILTDKDKFGLTVSSSDFTAKNASSYLNIAISFDSM